MTESSILLDAPNVGSHEIGWIQKAIDSTYVSTAGPFVPQFEQAMAKRLNVPQAVALQSGTAALHMALVELGIGPGDEVIVPALTFVASANPIVYVGATPVFVDCDPKTWTLDPACVEEAVTPRTKAIIVVHLYGQVAAMNELVSVADRTGVAIIEDATESLGSVYYNQPTGTFGHIGCFSFNGNKLMTTGGGGLLISREAEKVDHVRFIINQARDEAQGYVHPEIGYNLRMTNLEAALGLAQQERLDEFIQIKRVLHQVYRERLANQTELSFQQEQPGSDPVPWLTCVRFHQESADLMQKALREKGIPSRRLFNPIDQSPPYHDSRYIGSHRDRGVWESSLCLPSSTQNKPDQIEIVCETLLDLLKTGV